MPTSLDLFTGAGGFTLGFQRAGFKCGGAIEADRFASATFNLNFPNIPLYTRDVRSFDTDEIENRFSGVDVVVGGPPCQGFSVAGPSQYGIIDKRNTLIFELLRFVEVLSPSICILENVKGILSGKLSPGRRAIDDYISTIKSLGYVPKVFILQTAEFGVPQWRERVFILGAKKNSYLPESIEGKFGKKGASLRSVGEALSDLPALEPGRGTEETIPYTSKALNEYQEWTRQNSKGIANHVAMKHTTRLIERFKHICPGGSLVNVPAEHGQRKRNGTELDANKRFKMNNQRLDPAKISTAITASFQSNFVHPKQHRNLTAREGARLQSFPDHFVFRGPRTLMSRTLLEREDRLDEIGLSQYNQIGNAVPPLLAEAIGKAIIRNL